MEVYVSDQFILRTIPQEDGRTLLVLNADIQYQLARALVEGDVLVTASGTWVVERAQASPQGVQCVVRGV